ncbi:MAG: asparagine synthase (glutamine-hydrolyzing) [Clostridia bacterium]|nr:asparagine synthase (glutamine-hydrolyzing) [Clostridia bacterium]
MCGFVGFSGVIHNRDEILNRMKERIVHRGPDMSGDHIDEEVALGFVRLSIIDLADGAQPMYNEDGSVVIVFNGEIYNFGELREELIALGHTFRTRCDTEVLIHGYEEFGRDIVKRLRGMFAFVIWDKNKRELFGARDHFGIKPFYYTRLGDDILFGSEIKSFLEHPSFEKRVNPRALRSYLTFQYPATEETFFEGVFRLPAAHSFVMPIGGEMKIERYWDVDFKSEVDKVSFDECRDIIDSAVHESVAAHRISDVKVGSFLSGGVDSSYITAVLMPNETFSVGFAEDKFNETDEASELSARIGVKNYKHLLTPDECFDAFSDIQYHMDEPQSNPSSVPLYFLAKLAAEHVTVVLSGEGADEIFAGYEWYDETRTMKKYKRLPAFLRRWAAGVARKLPYFRGREFIIKCSGRPEDYFIGQALVFPEKEAAEVLTEKYRAGQTPKDITAPIYRRVSDKDELIKKQYLDLNLWLPGDILLKADKMSMAHSLELRVPYLDKKIMEMAEGVPSEYKINGIDTKYVFRVAANKTLPDEWAHRKKKGFPVPIRLWLREEKYRNIVAEHFEAEWAGEFFNREKIMTLLDDHYAGRANNQRKIWTVFTFLVWYKRFFIDSENK